MCAVSCNASCKACVCATASCKSLCKAYVCATASCKASCNACAFGPTYSGWFEG